MHLFISVIVLVGCTDNTKQSEQEFDNGTQITDTDTDSSSERVLETTWAVINEGYCTVEELTWGGSDWETVVSPISNGPGSSDDQPYTSAVGSLLEVSCDAYVTPQYDPQITVDVSGCLQVYCDGVGEDAGCDRNEIHVYIYARGAYGGGNQASDCELDSTIGAGY